MTRRTLTAFILIVVAFGGPVAQAQEPTPPARVEVRQTPAPRAEGDQTQKTPRPPRTPRTPRVETPETPAPYAEEGGPVQIEPVVVKLGRGGRLAVTTRIASIKVTGWDRDTVEATATGESGPRQLKAEVTGDPSRARVFLYVPAAARRYDREIEIQVNLPRYAEVETLESQSGDIEVANLDAGVAISSGNGAVNVSRVGSLKVGSRSGEIQASDIKGEVIARNLQGGIIVTNVAGRVDVSAANGDVQVRNAEGDVRATSATGDVDVRCAKGRAEASSASGSITLIGIGGDAEASTASGDVSFKSAIRAAGNYRLKSISGEVEMTVQPDPPGFTATLITYSGEIETAFPLKLDSGLPGGEKNRRVTGRFGDGQAKVTLDSFSGTVRIVKGAAAAMKDCNK
jgi:putative adhesin